MEIREEFNRIINRLDIHDDKIEQYFEHVTELDKLFMRLLYVQFDTQMDIKRLSLEMKEFKDEMKEFKDRVDGYIADMNRKWGEMANKMGTLAEDIIAPGLPYAVKNEFGLEVTDLMVRREKKRNGKRREYDVIAIAGEYVFVVDVKSKYNRILYLDRFQEMLEDFNEWFPEFSDYKIVPVIASFCFPEDILRVASRRKCLAIQMGGSYLEFVNTDEVKLENMR